ncbi:hypothetical protein [Nocardioides guangzhouensis]|uniref:hypothetical protein n=1 Tax=Nocardioides guangzhouensis TaxID=2497878 RepID=UPI00158CDBE1|nr:hypothetical protein [Nocardioides guangzhouensis]
MIGVTLTRVARASCTLITVASSSTLVVSSWCCSLSRWVSCACCRVRGRVLGHRRRRVGGVELARDLGDQRLGAGRDAGVELGAEPVEHRLQAVEMLRVVTAEDLAQLGGQPGSRVGDGGRERRPGLLAGLGELGAHLGRGLVHGRGSFADDSGRLGNGGVSGFGGLVPNLPDHPLQGPALLSLTGRRESMGTDLDSLGDKRREVGLDENGLVVDYGATAAKRPAAGLPRHIGVPDGEVVDDDAVEGLGEAGGLDHGRPPCHGPRCGG